MNRKPVIIVLLLVTIAFLQSRNAPDVKAALNLGLVNGATVGIGLPDKVNPNLESYINAYYLYSKYVAFGGVNYEVRNYKSDRFYYVLTGGIDYGRHEIIYFEPPDENDPKYTKFLMPHITFGLGYQFYRGKTSSAFVEWDIGFKFSVTNINLGITF